MPQIAHRSRFWFFAALIGTGLVQAAVAALMTISIPMLPAAHERGQLGWLFAQLLWLALVLGLLRALDRVIAEQLGQQYVREVRQLLLRSALTSRNAPNLGITVARATNDLSAVRNWIALGIAPLLSGIPLVAGILVALALIHPLFMMGTLSSLVTFGIIIWLLTNRLFQATRELRRQRGKMAALIADTSSAAMSIRVAGGVDRELRRIDRHNERLIDGARQRATYSGAVRGLAFAASAAAMVVIGTLAAGLRLPTEVTTTAVLLTGIVATPLSDIGRVVEYRQAFLAARVVLDRPLRQAREELLAAKFAITAPPSDSSQLVVRGLEIDGQAVPDLYAQPGDRILVAGSDPHRQRHLLELLLGELRPAPGGIVSAGGVMLADAAPKLRRKLLGLASEPAAIERGTIERFVRYRTGDDRLDTTPLLEQVGIADVVAALPRGVRTQLRRGGQPLAPQHRAALKLARALAAEPPLLIVDRIQASLNEPGRRALDRIRATYPGIIIEFATNAAVIPAALSEQYQRWGVDPDLAYGSR